MYQSTNTSSNQYINQSINKPSDQWINKSISPSIDHISSQMLVLELIAKIARCAWIKRCWFREVKSSYKEHSITTGLPVLPVNTSLLFSLWGLVKSALSPYTSWSLTTAWAAFTKSVLEGKLSRVVSKATTSQWRPHVEGYCYLGILLSR